MIRDLKSRLDGSKKGFSNDKNSILQETKIFSKIPINSKKCAKLLTRILSLLNCGKENLSETESSDIFFSVTRLFEADDERLRRLIYLLIKSLPVNETEIFIVTSSLTKDMNSQNFVYRANAIRSICYIMRGAVSPQIERYLKSSLVDKQPYVSSSTLLCCIGMFTRSSEMLKRWFSEITTCLSNKSEMVRFHATILLFLLRFNDKQSIRKLITTLDGAGNHVVCFIIRFLTANTGFAETAPFIVKYLTHENPMVKLEAAKSVVSLLVAHYRNKGTVENFGYDLTQVLETFKNFLVVGDVFTFAAMRQISILAKLVPKKINVVNKQLETFISHNNRTLSSLALLTLLQTGSSDTIENLLTQASNLSGDFKLEVTRAIKRLCISHPDKYKHVLKFLAQNFRQESSFESKNEMVDATIFITNEIPKAKNQGFCNLCEFIEDCEYPIIISKVLKFLGDNVPDTYDPQDFVRFIYNRLMLENALVRSTSVDALENIAKQVPTLKPYLIEIIKNTSTDGNFELQEQVNTVYNFLKYSNLIDTKGFSLEFDLDKDDMDELYKLYDEMREEVYISDLSDKLLEKIEKGGELGEFDLHKPKETEVISSTRTTEETELLGVGPIEVQQEPEVIPKLVLDKVEGKVEETSVTRLTEEEEDYNVSVTLYVNMKYLVLQFTVENTLNDQYLENVSITLNTSSCTNQLKYKLLHNETLEKVDTNEAKKLHLVLSTQLDEQHQSQHFNDTLDSLNNLEEKLLFGSAQVTLNFTVVCSNDRYEESYNINNLNLGVSSYMSGLKLEQNEYVELWNQMQNNEQVGTFNLQFRLLEDASTQIVNFFGMTVCLDGSQNKIYWTNMAGKLLGLHTVLARASFAQPNPNSCILKLQVRSKQENISKFLVSQLE